jgi:hypothetical protein
MKVIFIALSILGLILTVAPSFFVWYQIISWTFHVQLMFAGMVLWFISAPFWMKTD